jgi:DNA modification methylase
MRLYSENKQYKLYQGNMLDMLEVIEANSIDSIVTDPPYRINKHN